MDKVYLLWNYATDNDYPCLVGVFKTLEAAKKRHSDLEYKQNEYLKGRWNANYPKRSDGSIVYYAIDETTIMD